MNADKVPETVTSPRVDALRRVFTEGISAADIAEPLVSFDVSAEAVEVAEWMRQRDFTVVGLRCEGLVMGMFEAAGQPEGPCRRFLRPLPETQVVRDTSPLADVIAGLDRQPRLFVTALRQIAGIITRADLQKPPVRMWLFGMITLMEMRITRMIQQDYAETQWQRYLSEERLAAARRLWQERRRRNQDLTLLDCLQFSDKGQIVARSPRLRSMTRYTSRRQIEKDVKLFERLRNNLAHSQDIVTSDWETIVGLARNLDRVLTGPEHRPSTGA
jgi:hypothetical protein